mmetsp:Transcript_72389/g.114656  ORF Transcript_72389/g.114656 Transcript_72389/m.114656 type:complete len:102 (+) Transcript_72389:1-306(+)
MPCDIPFDRFMELILDLRETNHTTVKDIMSLWKQISTKFLVQEAELQAIKHKAMENHRNLQTSVARIEDALKLVAAEMKTLTGSSLETSSRSKDGTIEETM